MNATISPGKPDISELVVRALGCDWDEDWDRLASWSDAAGFMQSSAWSRFKRLEGYESKRLGLFEDGRLIGGASLLTHPSNGVENIMLCPEGPVLPWEETGTAREGLRAIIRYAKEIGSKTGAIGLRIEPHLGPPRPSLLRNWTRAPVDLTPVQTLFLNLKNPEEELISQMNPKGRYNIRLSERRGVTVRRSTELRDVRVFYNLFEETAQRNGFFSEPYGFFLNLGSALFPSKTAELFFAEWHGKIISSIIVVFFGRRATYLYGGSSAEYREVMPNYALQWAAILAAREQGCLEYDLYGFDPFRIPDHLYAGISRFKRQFGGQHKEWIGAWDHIFYDHLADRLIERLPEFTLERRTL